MSLLRDSRRCPVPAEPRQDLPILSPSPPRRKARPVATEAARMPIARSRAASPRYGGTSGMSRRCVASVRGRTRAAGRNGGNSSAPTLSCGDELSAQAGRWALLQRGVVCVVWSETKACIPRAAACPSRRSWVASNPGRFYPPAVADGRRTTPSRCDDPPPFGCDGR